nr:pyridoxal phosphate-dependent aminotransferase [Corynebacterium sp. UBA5992]
MPPIASTIQSVPASGIRRIFELAAGMEDVIPLSVGEPGLAVSQEIRAAGARAWREGPINYTPNSGLPALRSAIRGKLALHNGYAVEEEQIHVTAGGAQALHMAMTFTLSAGDEILIPDPGYATFAMAPRLLGAVPVPYELRQERGFLPDVAELEKLVGPRTRVLLVNSPSNPLGVIFPEETVRELVGFAARHDLWIISDEVYEYLTFEPGFTSFAAIDTEARVFSIYSFSKTYGLTGARIGYLVTPPGLSERFRAAQEAIVSCVSAPGQAAALAAIGGDGSDIAAARTHYAGNIQAACELLDSKGVSYQRPAGALYLWIDVSYASGGDVAAWAEKFLLECKVALAPGVAFGAAGEGWVRVCIAGEREELLQGLSRLPSSQRIQGED